MKYRPFGNTGIRISELVYGAGAVGGLLIRGSLHGVSREVKDQFYSLNFAEMMRIDA